MERIFSKDECSPDAKTLNEFEHENDIRISNEYPAITINYQDWQETYFVSTSGIYYMEERYCGVYENLYSFKNKEEYELHLKRTLIDNCDMQFLN